MILQDEKAFKEKSITAGFNLGPKFPRNFVESIDPKSSCGVHREPKQGGSQPMTKMSENFSLEIPFLQRSGIKKTGADPHRIFHVHGEQPGQVLRLMGKIAIHGDQGFVVVIIGIIKDSEMGGSYTQCGGSMHHPDVAIFLGKAIQNLAGAITRIIINKKNIEGQGKSSEPCHHTPYVFGLIQGGNSHEDSFHDRR